ncbi:SulP family inorganic anion transporter [Anaerolineae bacterium CFX9]|nr:SulP family inorganic anion transporter [Anaerolineae bacterium CFX9]
MFSSDLAQFLPRGVGLILLGTAIVSIVIALTSSLAGMIGVPQDTPAALMALMTAGVAATLKGQSPEAVYSTAVGAIMLGSLLTGIVFIVLGRFKLSGFARYVPYPVVGGFLAGTGYVIAKGGLSVLVNVPPGPVNLPMFFAPSVLWSWLPALLFGVALLLVLRRFNHFLITPGALILAALRFGFADIRLLQRMLSGGFGISAARANPFCRTGFLSALPLHIISRQPAQRERLGDLMSREMPLQLGQRQRLRWRFLKQVDDLLFNRNQVLMSEDAFC